MPEDVVKGDFSLINVTRAVPTYPLQAEDDPGHVVYKFTCRVKRTDYPGVVPALDSPMTAGACGISSRFMPFEDPNALFVGDIGWKQLPWGRIEFIRRFATIPASQSNRLVGSRSWPFPAYRGIVPKTPADPNDDLFRNVELRTTNANPASLYKDVQYFLRSQEDSVEEPAVFRPTVNGYAVDYVSNGGSGTFNGTALNGESVNDVYNVAASSPSLAEYGAQIVSGEKLVVDAYKEEYLGNIQRLVTLKMKAQ